MNLYIVFSVFFYIQKNVDYIKKKKKKLLKMTKKSTTDFQKN